MYGLQVSIGSVLAIVVACLIGLAAVIALAIILVGVNRHAVRNPDPTRSIRDPDTGISEDEWMDGMR